MVILSEITEKTSTMEENSLDVLQARDLSGISNKLVQSTATMRNLSCCTSPSVSFVKHLARTQGQSQEITAEMGAIMPYVPKMSEEDHSKTGLHAFLSSTLKTEMQRYVSELKYATALEAAPKIPKDVINVAPLSSFRIPDGYEIDEQMYTSPAQKRRIPTTYLGERVFSFTFPRQFVSDDKQVDDLIVNEMGRQYTFSERLEGWKIERRQRINGRFDLYYNHMLSRTQYRSTVEVLNFLLHESCKGRRKSSGKEKADETDADSAQKSKVAVKRKRWPSYEAESSRKMKQKFESSHVESDVENFYRESRGNRSSLPNPSRVYKSERKFYMSAEERREKVEKFLTDSYDNLGKSRYMIKREEEVMPKEEAEFEEEDEEHDFHISLRQKEKEEEPKDENVEKVTESDEESDEETVSEIMVEDEGIKHQDTAPEEKGTAIAGEENSKATDEFAEIDEAFMEIEKNPIKDPFMMSGSSSYFPPYSFDDYDLIFPPQN